MSMGRKKHTSLLRSQNLGLFIQLTYLSCLLLIFGSGILLHAGPSNEIMTNEETLDEGAKKFLQKRISDNTNRLPVAWLMSFPNSGTSYTSHLVRKVTGRRTASNYRSENRGKDGESNSVFEYSPGGPFWSDANSPEYEDASSGYLLTKTHCGEYHSARL